MKLAWRLGVLSFLLLTSCMLFVLLNRSNPTGSSQVHRVPSHSLYRKQALLHHFRREPAVTQEWSLLSTANDTEILTRGLRAQRIEKPLANKTGLPVDRLTSPTVARNVSHGGRRIESANSTASTSIILKTSRTLPSRVQNYEEVKRKHSEVENVSSIKSVSEKTKVETSSSQKQSKQLHEMESNIVHANDLAHSVISTTERHHSQEHKSENTEITTKLPQSRKMASPPLDSSPLSNKEPVVELLVQKHRARQNSEAAKNKIMLTIRSTMSLHKKRLPVMLDTWLTTVNASNVFLVTDGFDEEYIARAGKLGKAS